MRPAALDPRTSWIGFLLCASLGLAVFLAVIEPTSSRGLTLGGRLLFWTAHVLIPIGLAQAAQVTIQRLTWIARRSPWLSVGLAGLVGAALFAPLAVILDAAFPVVAEVSDTGETWTAALADELASLTPPIALTWVALNASRLLRLSSLPQPAEPPSSGPAFMGRVRPEVRGTLVGLSAELHYLRVFTTRGEDLILYGFGQAMEALGPRAGLRVHRSHWVDPAFVTGQRKDGARLILTTTTGARFPVSRARRRAVEDALAERAPS